MPGLNVHVVRWVGMVKHKIAVNREAGSTSRPRETELGYSRTIYTPPNSGLSEARIDSSETELTGGGTQSSLRSFNGEESRSRYLYYLVKLCFLVAVTVLAVLFQIEKRPFEPKFYTTNDPDETRRDGQDYTCGCSLPSPMQGPEYPSTNQSGVDICYEEQNLNVSWVLKYSDMALDTMTSTPLYLDWDTSEEVSGFSLSQEAHDIHGPISGYNESLEKSNNMFEMATDLYRDGINRQPDLVVNVTWLTSPDFISFPPPYLRLAFIYQCDNCSLCSLETVNNIFAEVARNEEVPWGGCFYYESGDHCNSTSGQRYYQAKCTLYPTSSLPANFAVKNFLSSFLKLPIKSITAASPSGSYIPGTMSFQPSTVYLNFSRFVSSNITLYYYEIPEEEISTSWTQLAVTFPTLDYCPDVMDITIYNSSSMCNAFATSQTPSYDLTCIHIADISDSNCQDLMTNSSVDNAINLFHEVGRDFTDVGPQPKLQDYEDLVCHQSTPNNISVPPYLVNWTIPVEMNNDTLSRFLEDKILQQEWLQRSGVCFQRHRNVVTWGPGPLILQTNCRSSAPTSRSQSEDYCWLTGKYHKLQDDYSDDWRDLEDLEEPDLEYWNDQEGPLSFSNSSERHRFACYRSQRQNTLLWLFIQLGIIFGWIGTLDLLFKTLKWMLRKRIQWIQDHRTESLGGEQEEQDRSDTNPSDNP